MDSTNYLETGDEKYIQTFVQKKSPFSEVGLSTQAIIKSRRDTLYIYSTILSNEHILNWQLVMPPMDHVKSLTWDAILFFFSSRH